MISHGFPRTCLQTYVKWIGELREVGVPAVAAGDAARVGHLHRRVHPHRVHEDRPVVVQRLEQTARDPRWRKKPTENATSMLYVYLVIVK